jgi:dienelactone hydrolase
MGYNPSGWFGSPVIVMGGRGRGGPGGAPGGAAAPAGPPPERLAQLSELDVRTVMKMIREEFTVDPQRTYLMGHSMGAIGTWAMGSKFSQTWAALVAFSGVGQASLADNMKGIPHFIVHGDADNTVNVSGSRNMVAELKKLNANVTYVEVPGGSHTDVVVPNLPKAFEFMAAQRRVAPAGTKQ